METILIIILSIVWLVIAYVAYKPLVKGDEFQFKRALRFILWVIVIIILAVILYELYELVDNILSPDIVRRKKY